MLLLLSLASCQLLVSLYFFIYFFFFFCFTPRHFLLRLLCLCIIFGSIERNSVQFIELWKRWASQAASTASFQPLAPAPAPAPFTDSISSNSNSGSSFPWLLLRFSVCFPFQKIFGFGFVFILFFFRVPFTSFDCKVFYYAIPTDWLTVGAHYNNRN